ncbi:SARTTc3 ORF1 protein [Gryllus bimaculatus]|nr:SARTTc3 ORF1 protein [Gryllus bimaculatus]
MYLCKYKYIHPGVYSSTPTGTEQEIAEKERPKRTFHWIGGIMRRQREDVCGVLTDSKNKLQVAGALDKVNSVRKTKSGDVALLLKEGEMEVKSIITEQLERTNARIVDHRRTILHVKQLDAITTAKELQGRLRAETGNEDVTVRSMRPAYGETQSATVEANEATAEHLCQIGRLKVGMVYCSVSRRLDVRRCHRCWSYGHIATSCRGEDRRNKCYNCAHEGHIANACKNPAYCPLCKKHHRAATE